MDPFAPCTHSRTVTWREWEVWLPITRVRSVHFEEPKVWTSALFVIGSIAYFSIAAGVFVERSAEATFFGNPWTRTSCKIFIRLFVVVVGHQLDSTQ